MKAFGIRQRRRKTIEEALCWLKSVAGLRSARQVGPKKLEQLVPDDGYCVHPSEDGSALAEVSGRS